LFFNGNTFGEIARRIVVKTLRGSTRGVIVRLLEDGLVVWQPDGSEPELTALPESLLLDARGR
jgi:hypothetical protein